MNVEKMTGLIINERHRGTRGSVKKSSAIGAQTTINTRSETSTLISYLCHPYLIGKIKVARAKLAKAFLQELADYLPEFSIKTAECTHLKTMKMTLLFLSVLKK